MQLFLVGHVSSENTLQIRGVFSTRKRAESACEDETHFVGPLFLDERFPLQTTEWKDLYFPHKDGFREQML